jgi:hypothetical protein
MLKNSRPNAHPPWSGRSKALEGNYLQWTCDRPDDVPSHLEKVLKQERFSREIFRKSCRTIVRPDGPCPPSGRRPGIFFPDAHLSPQPINRGPCALRTARIRREFH